MMFSPLSACVRQYQRERGSELSSVFWEKLDAASEHVARCLYQDKHAFRKSVVRHMETDASPSTVFTLVWAMTLVDWPPTKIQPSEIFDEKITTVFLKYIRRLDVKTGGQSDEYYFIISDFMAHASAYHRDALLSFRAEYLHADWPGDVGDIIFDKLDDIFRGAR